MPLCSPRASGAWLLVLAQVTGVVVTFLAALASPAGAHSLSPSLLVVHELEAGRATVLWKTPVLRLPGTDLKPVLPPDCVGEAPAAVSEDYDSETTTWSVRCSELSMIGRSIRVDGLAEAKTDVLLRIELRDGRSVDTVLRPAEPVFVVPARENRLALVVRYIRLGFDHILSGYDHLLFVLGLMLLVRGARVLIETISAFTLGHSITLALAVLDIAHVPPAPVEVLIAFSIFVLATELARPDTGATLMRERPWAMAACFGLLHGLGFAGSLRAAGLPADGIPLALVSFNGGIELGQLTFVAAILATGALMRSLAVVPAAWSRRAVIYAMGSVAAFWMIERAIPLLATPALAATFLHR